MPAKRTHNRERNTTLYKKNRALILSDNPPCHWCGVNVATEADHLIETDRNGTSELSNLVPACRKCNATRGNKYRAARDAQHTTPKQKPKVTSANSTPVRVTEHQHSQRFFSGTSEAPVSPIILSQSLPPFRFVLALYITMIYNFMNSITHHVSTPYLLPSISLIHPHITYDISLFNRSLCLISHA